MIIFHFANKISHGLNDGIEYALMNMRTLQRDKTPIKLTYLADWVYDTKAEKYIKNRTALESPKLTEEEIFLITLQGTHIQYV